MTYAIIKVAGKQYRVREGERLLVDRLAQDEGATITPTGVISKIPKRGWPATMAMSFTSRLVEVPISVQHPPSTHA